MYPQVQKALAVVGNHGAYQKILIVFLFLMAGQVDYMLLGPSFIFMNPLFECSFSNQKVDESIACPRLSQCKISNSFTIVARLGLYCDRQSDRTDVQSTIFIGSILGLLLINYFSYLKGKRLAILAVQIISIIGVSMIIIGGYIGSVLVLKISQFICGFSSSAMIILITLVPSEFCEEDFRQKSLVIIFFSFPLSSILFGILYYFYNLWSDFLIFIVLIPMITVTIVSAFYFVEGPNFLYRKQKQKQCLQSLRVLAEYNGTQKQFQQVAANFKLQVQVEKKQPLTLTAYVKVLIILIVADVGGSMYSVGTSFALNSIGYEYGVNMIGNGVISVIAFSLLGTIVTKLPKRQGLVCFKALSIGLGLIFFSQYVQHNKIVTSIILGMISFFSTLSNFMYFVFFTQYFPLNVQGPCIAIMGSIAKLGSFLGPKINAYCVNHQIYPLLALSVIAFFTILVPLLFLKDKAPEKQVKETLVEQDTLLVYS